jgi:hypothetical protein
VKEEPGPSTSYEISTKLEDDEVLEVKDNITIISANDNIPTKSAVKRSHSRSLTPELSNNKISKSESTSSNEAVLGHEEDRDSYGELLNY